MALLPGKTCANAPASNASKDALVALAIRTIDRYRMLTPGDCILAGVSGGPDSIALLHVLHTLCNRYSVDLAVAHLDHGTRPQTAEQEAEFVRRFSRSLDLPCHLGKIAKPPGGSLEEKLRQARYAFFERTAVDHGYNKVALGHQADDNAEAVLMRLFRGSGIQGLSGIPPVRDEKFIRPLIGARRSDIIAYLDRHKLVYMEDASNKDLQFERNKIRHALIPGLQRDYSSQIVQHLNRLAELCREEDQWIEASLRPLVAAATLRQDAQGLELRPAVLQGAPRAVQRRILRAALRQWQGDLRRIGADHIDALIDLLPSVKRGRGIHLPGRVQARRTDDCLAFMRHPGRRGKAAPAPSYEYVIESLERMPLQLVLAETGCRLNFQLEETYRTMSFSPIDQNTVLLDPAQIVFPLRIRNFRPGDRFHPFGMQGTQKLKDLFINRRIPADQRRKIPLLVSAGVILWVTGIRRGAQAAVTAATRQVLRIEVVPGSGGRIAPPLGSQQDNSCEKG